MQEVRNHPSRARSARASDAISGPEVIADARVLSNLWLEFDTLIERMYKPPSDNDSGRNGQ